MTRLTCKAAVAVDGKSAGAAVCILLAVILTGCNHHETARTPETSPGTSLKAGPQVEVTSGVSVGGGKSYAHVTYKPEVKSLEAAQVDASIDGISSDGHVLSFKNAGPEILALKEGDVLLIKNQMVRKVLATRTEGDHTYLLTDEAAITDVVADGDIQINTPLSFHGVKKTSALRPFSRSFLDIFDEPLYADGVLPCLAPDSAAADSAKAVIGSVISGWTITQWQVSPGSNELDVNLAMTKNTNGFLAQVTMTGFVTNFDFISTLGIHNGSGSKIFNGVQNMTGKLQFNWEIAKGTPGVWAVEDRIKLPAGISIPLGTVLAGMPLSLDISSALLIHPALTGGNEVSKGGFAITWTGGGNFSSGGGSPPSGTGSMNTTFDVTADTNVSPVAPNGMVISYCAPRLELKYQVFGEYANTLCKFASGITGLDKVAAVMESMLPASIKSALSASPFTATNVLSSKADVFVQFISTEGVTHSSNVTLAPCSKQQLVLTAQGGGDAQLFGLTKGAKTTTDLFSKAFTRWNPASDFCKSVGK